MGMYVYLTAMTAVKDSPRCAHKQTKEKQPPQIHLNQKQNESWKAANEASNERKTTQTKQSLRKERGTTTHKNKTETIASEINSTRTSGK